MSDNLFRIPLTKGLFAIVDEWNFDWVNQFNWCAQTTKRTDTHAVYAARRVGPRILLLHREILRAGPGQEVDHKNRDTLDCREGNLRLATGSQNSANKGKASGCSSRFKGVCFVPQLNSTNPWLAYFGGSGKAGAPVKRKYLGYFVTEEIAAAAYNSAALGAWGEFAVLNKI